MMSPVGRIPEKGTALEKFTEQVVRVLHWTTIVIEVLVAVALVMLAAGMLIALGGALMHLAGSDIAVDAIEFNKIIGMILEIFILVELFRIAVAYMRHVRVIPTVLEAALVAVARKFVVFEGGTNYLANALGLSALLLAVAFSWWLLARGGSIVESAE
jgi:uncharacterized membrane protein (DUF373 family)